MDQETEQDANGKRAAKRSKRQVISVPVDGATTWLEELGKYFANEAVVAIMDDSALDEGFERGEILAHGGEAAITSVIWRHHEKHPTDVLRIVQPALLPQRLRSR